MSPALALRRCRSARPQRPPPAATARRALALGREITAATTRLQGLPVRLGSPNGTDDQEGKAYQGPWSPAHPARQPGTQHARHPKSPSSRTLQLILTDPLRNLPMRNERFVYRECGSLPWGKAGFGMGGAED